MKKKMKIVAAVPDVQYGLIKLMRSMIMFLLLGLLLLGGMESVSAQDGKVTLSGVVKDEAGNPLSEVTVQVKGTATGIFTNSEGKYTLETIQVSGILVFSFVGLQTAEVPYSGSGTYDVSMKSSTVDLDEVVVVGYGTQKMRNVTGAVATVKPEEISNLPVGNLGAALEGTVTGLSVSGGQARPGVGATLIIRQPYSLSKYGASQGPLYVIDDFITDENAFNNLDADEIESISVLKDAAAAIYGARSSQGAILVKTKHGKEGAPSISFSSQITYNDEVKRADMLDAYEYGIFYNRYKGKSGSEEYSSPTTVYFQPDELDTMKYLNYDWLDMAWKGSYSTSQNLNISGGTRTATYFAGVSYYSQNGNLSTLNYNRWNYRAGADINVADHFKVSLQVSGDFADRKQTFNKIGGEVDENDYLSLMTTPGYLPPYIYSDDYTYPLPILRYGPQNKRTDNDIIYYNYFEIEELANIKHNKPTNTRINAIAEYDFGWSKILNGLKFKLAYSKTLGTNLYKQLGSKYTGYYFTARSGSGHHLYYGDITAVPATVLTYAVSNGNRMLRDGERSDNYQLNFFGMYDRSFGKHNVSALFSIEKNEYEWERVRYYKDDPLLINNGQSNSASGTADGETSRTESGLLSYIGRLNYSYANKYLFEFLLRSDASTKFAPENYWGTFPSFSAGWVISEENFFKNSVNWMSFLKLRASLGFLGGDRTGAWMWRQRYTYQTNKGAMFGINSAANVGWGLKMEAAPNPYATWDDDTKFNVGIDTRFLDSRLSVTVDGYLDHNYNMLVQRDALVPVTIGGALASENFDAIDAYGIELSLSWRDNIGEDIIYFLRLNTGYDDAKYRKKDWPEIIEYNDVYPDGPVDMGVWGYDCLGMFRSQADIDKYVADYAITSVFNNATTLLKPGMLYYRDVRGNMNADGSYQGPDGIIDDKDMIQLSKKSGNPYGFTFNFGGEWKGLSLSALITASWGGYSEISGNARYINESKLDYMNVPKFWNDMFTLPSDTGNIEGNIDAKYPNMFHSTFNDKTSNFWQISSFRMALRTATLSYTLPKQLVNKIGVESCRINLTGMNLLSFYNPLPGKFMDINSNYGAFPNLRSISLGINLSF
jgi:TonB-linked SusC/RagA family outer membrane protein